VIQVTFTEWLKTKRGEDSPIGDLADDAACDRRWLSEGATLDRFQRRLIFAGACTETRKTLDAAWQKYRRAAGTATPPVNPPPAWSISAWSQAALQHQQLAPGRRTAHRWGRVEVHSASDAGGSR
jgi:hypothetical protein